MIVCVFCDKPVTQRVAYERVAGWTRFRTAGGTNALRVMERLGRYAHAACLDEQEMKHRQQPIL